MLNVLMSSFSTVRLNDETRMKKDLEKDLDNLKKDIDETKQNRDQLKKEAELVKGEVERLEKEHKDVSHNYLKFSSICCFTWGFLFNSWHMVVVGCEDSA